MKDLPIFIIALAIFTFAVVIFITSENIKKINEKISLQQDQIQQLLGERKLPDSKGHKFTNLGSIKDHKREFLLAYALASFLEKGE